MVKTDLVDYIKKELSKNTSRDTLMSSLKVGGWTEQDITDSFAEAENIKRNSDRKANMHVPAFHIVKITITIIVILIVTFLVVAYILGGQP